VSLVYGFDLNVLLSIASTSQGYAPPVLRRALSRKLLLP
jgi:hypothetical protein